MKPNRPVFFPNNPFRSVAQITKQQVVGSRDASPDDRKVIIATIADHAFDVCSRIVDSHIPFGKIDPHQTGDTNELGTALERDDITIEEIGSALYKSILGLADIQDKETAHAWLDLMRIQMRNIVDFVGHPHHGREVVELEIGGG